jgi:hypothetical protein
MKLGKVCPDRLISGFLDLNWPSVSAFSAPADFMGNYVTKIKVEVEQNHVQNFLSLTIGK